MNISETNQHEYDLWTLLWRLKMQSKLNIIYTWVKGHQDELKTGEKIYGPFPRPVQLNINMDSLAKDAAKAGLNTTTIRPTYSTTKLALYTKQNIQIGDIHEYIQYVVNAPPMIAYLIKKNNWTFEQLQLINWDNLDAAIKGYKPFYKTKIAQLMHDWQYIGERKKLFNHNHDKCPAQCGEPETKQHYLECKDTTMQASRQSLMRAFRQRLTLLNTYPGLITVLCKIMLEGFTSEWWTHMTCTTKIDDMIYTAIKLQSELGWMSVTKGYLIYEWEDIQQYWVKTSCGPHNKYYWGKEVIIAIHTYVYDCWKARNDILHGKTEKSQKAQKKLELQHKVRVLYSKGRANLTLREKNYFKMPLEIRLKKGNDSLILWIQIVESIFKRKGIARQEKLDNWLEKVDDTEACNTEFDLLQPKVKNKKDGMLISRNEFENEENIYNNKDGEEASRS